MTGEGVTTDGVEGIAAGLQPRRGGAGQGESRWRAAGGGDDSGTVSPVGLFFLKGQIWVVLII